jgi:hypothetical protein
MFDSSVDPIGERAARSGERADARSETAGARGSVYSVYIRSSPSRSRSLILGPGASPCRVDKLGELVPIERTSKSSWNGNWSKKI